MIDWEAVDTVFLDMDGTLLDLHFDNYFWLEHVPKRYSQKHQIPLEVARQELIERYRRVEGTIEWYCLDYWSRELKMDIPALKEEVDHLISVHPHVPEFLGLVRAAGKRVLLLTNAHGKSIDLKMKRTQIGEYLDRVISAHELGLPKEDTRFWTELQRVEPFDPEKTLLIDDSTAVLRSARAHGVRFLLAVLKPDTKRPEKAPDGFPAVKSFRGLGPTPGRWGDAV